MRPALALPLLLLATACATTQAPAPSTAPDTDALAREVAAAETAFARSMAERDFETFASHIADDAIFQPGPATLRGKPAILAAWSKYFEGPEAPFSWKPETVVVLDSGQLAQSKGPVFNPAGEPILEFRSTWRREADGEWKVVFDDGTCLCPRGG
ncbi:YybH family protein [Arenimonas donghaensis]|uniref:DUF4440 domain-containing protein n=1 Tax=Arenimonas donghaensis DSM 18148 = HO3-R19 TaxID=1121014 RepID=A0A087MFH7_9GAMM|nr:nuclear transport factor 2 family protein [Arenimonas donghaensis]KFL35630.1 hypothetical protein N788_07800 [Arenimonas donghaensis DSM 18148 = HO3-R19]